MHSALRNTTRLTNKFFRPGLSRAFLFMEMDAVTQNLYNRLDEQGRERLSAIVSSACLEIEREGVIDRLSPEWAARVNAPDPAAAAAGKCAAARAAGRQLILEDTPLPRADGSVARLAQIAPDPRFINCLALALIGNAETLMDSGVTRYRILTYYIRAEGDRSAVKSTVEALDGFYPRISFELLGDNEGERKPSLFKRLFGKKHGG